MALAQQQGVSVGGRDLVALGEHLLHSGCAVGINRAEGAGPPRCFAVVVRGAARREGPRDHRSAPASGRASACPGQDVEKPGGRRVNILGNPARGGKAWWSEGDDLVVSLVAPTGVDAIIAALDGVEPNALEHPTRMDLARSADEPGFVPVGLAFCDLAAFPPLPRQAVALGLDKIKRFDYRWGFHGPAIESIVGVVAPAPRTGIPALIDQPTFDARHLPPLPAGLAGFTVLSLDTARLYDQIVASLKVMEPPGSGTADQFRHAVNQAVGLKLREEFLAAPGVAIRVLHRPDPGQRGDQPAGRVRARNGLRTENGDRGRGQGSAGRRQGSRRARPRVSTARCVLWPTGRRRRGRRIQAAQGR